MHYKIVSDRGHALAGNIDHARQKAHTLTDISGAPSAIIVNYDTGDVVPDLRLNSWPDNIF